MKKQLKYIYLLFFVTIVEFSFTQNLLVNPSFEYYTSCPQNMAELEKAYPWATPLTYVIGAGFGSSDYFNFCWNTDNDVNILMQKQPPRTGNGYAHFIVFGFSRWREYVEGELKDTLVSNKCYYVKFHLMVTFYSGPTIYNIGAFLSEDFLSYDSTRYIPVHPQIENSVNNYITDTLNWMTVEGSFIASGGEKFITIGNFYDNYQTNSIINNPHATNPNTYFLIDDVSVYPCDAPIYFADAGGNKQLCKIEDSIKLGTHNLPDYSYWWYDHNKNLIDSVAQITVKPVNTTKYYLKVKDFKFDESWDSVIVTVNENCNYIIFIPNIFSPNSDGTNDILYVRAENIKELTISIYNRWGEKVFTSNDKNNGWDGTYKGKPCPAEVYVYYVNVTFANGVIEQKKGNITLVR